MRTDDFSDARLRESIASVADVFGNGDDCPEAERLVLSGRGELSPTDDEGVLLHLADCTACGAAWRIAREIGPRRAPSVHPAARRQLIRHTWVRAAAVAAMLLVAMSAGWYFLAPDPETPTVYREQEVDLVRSSLEEDERLPRDRFVLRWSAGPEGTIYDVLVTSERMEPLSRGLGLDLSEFQVPEETLGGLESGSRILWQVTAYLPDGRRIESKTFFVRIE
jgi:hypothetical protein